MPSGLLDVALSSRLPPGVASYVETLLGRQAMEVRVVRPRRSKLGDHRPPQRGVRVHRITINDDLNPYAFLTTLLHEVAHASTWERYHDHRRRGVRPHGREWQSEFAAVLRPIVGRDVLPTTVEAALAKSLEAPAAATCSDRGLVLALAEFDAERPGHVRVEDLPERSVFRGPNGVVFRAGRRLRTRRQCFELRTGREYRVHGLALVEAMAASAETARRRLRH